MKSPPVFMEIPKKITVNKVGESSVLVETAGAEKRRFTVMRAHRHERRLVKIATRPISNF